MDKKLNSSFKEGTEIIILTVKKSSN